MSTAKEKNFVIKHVFNDVMKMESHSSKEKKENHFKIPWELKICKFPAQFHFFLRCDPFPGTETNDWSIEVEIESKVFNEHKEEIRVTNHVYSKDRWTCKPRTCQIGHFPSEKIHEYLSDGNLTVECHVRIVKMVEIRKKKLIMFDESMKEFSDVVLIVEDEKFYVNKKHLASHSSYFKSLFFSKSRRSEITLNEIDANDFQCFLELINGAKPIDDNFVFGILQLADMFESRIGFERCEEFLIEKSQYTMQEKFQTSMTHKLKALTAKCISQMKTHADILSVVPEDAYKIDPQTWKDLLSRALKWYFFDLMCDSFVYENETIEGILMKESKQSLKDKFQASVTHKMEQLKKKCLSEMKTLEDVWSVVPEEDANQIDPPTWKQLLSRALEIDSANSMDIPSD